MTCGQDEIAKMHSVTEIVRVMSSKASSQAILHATLRVISALCLGNSYTPHKKNQTNIEKVSGIQVLVDLLKRNATGSIRLRSDIYYCLSTLCLNNPRNRKVLGKYLNRAGYNYDWLIKNLVSIICLRY